MIDNCTTGIYTLSSQVVFFGPPLPSLVPTISNCATAIMDDVSGQFDISFSPLLISNCTNGIQLTNGSKFTTDNTVTFSGVTYPRVIDVSSTYNAIQDPASPNGILTLTASGPMDPTFLTQQIAGTSALAITLDPTFAPNGVTVYQGKRYSLTTNNSLTGNTLIHW